MTELAGGCSCGAVRYSVARCVDALYCHCSRCRRSSGAPVSAWARVRGADFSLVAGEPRDYESRHFCAACGSTLYLEKPGSSHCAIAIGTLDEPERVAPRTHMRVDTQLSWLVLGDLLPRHDADDFPARADQTLLRGPADPAVTRDSPLGLREITSSNLRSVLLLDVTGPQRQFVASNAVSLAQAYFGDGVWHRAICAGDTPVGFVMAETMKEDALGLPMKGDPELWRFMVDERYQKLGFGRRALELIIAELRSWGAAESIWLSCVKAAGGPYDFYCRFGFVDTGVRDSEDGERIMRLPL